MDKPVEEVAKEPSKLKVLVVTDSPYASTGFGRVCRSLLGELDKSGKFEFTILAWNHFNTDVTLQSPYKIFAANMTNEVYGQNLFRQLLSPGQFDIVFTIADFELQNDFGATIIEYKKQKPIKWIAYTPVDSTTLKPAQLEFFKLADHPVTYTNFGKKVILAVEPNLKYKLKVIYHGTDLREFFHIDRKEVAEYRLKVLHVKPNDFLITNINRNQWRKDLVRTMNAFKELHTYSEKVHLYLHCNYEDTMGNNLLHEAVILGLDSKSIHFAKIVEHKGVSQEKLNMIYSASDLIVSTDLGEGWGLSQTEAMATKTPVLMPRNTSHIEIIGENEERGYLADSGANKNEFAVPYGYSNSMRPLTNIDSFVSKVKHIMKNKAEVAEKVEAAYDWVQQYTWEEVGKQWLELFIK